MHPERRVLHQVPPILLVVLGHLELADTTDPIVIKYPSAALVAVRDPRPNRRLLAFLALAFLAFFSSFQAWIIAYYFFYT